MNENTPPKELLGKNKNKEMYDYQFGLDKVLFKEYANNSFVVPIGIMQNKEKCYMDLTNVSSIFISGETGSGKSNFLNTLIVSLLMKNNPNDLQFIFHDSSNVEFNVYKNISEFGINTDIISPINQLKNLLKIINERKNILANVGMKNIVDYNSKNDIKIKQIFAFIDDAIDLFQVEDSIEIIKQIISDCSRYGVHLLLSTSAYLKKYVNDEILNMFTYVISFDLSSSEQSSVVNIKGAELLTVEGEALVKCRDNNFVQLQTPYISNENLKNIVEYIKNNTLK